MRQTRFSSSFSSRQKYNYAVMRQNYLYFLKPLFKIFYTVCDTTNRTDCLNRTFYSMKTLNQENKKTSPSISFHEKGLH